MILPIIAYGHPLLREDCLEIEEGKDVSELVSNMFDTMYGSQGVGLAGPQIGESLRIFIVDASPFAEEDSKDKDKSKKLYKLKIIFFNC